MSPSLALKWTYAPDVLGSNAIQAVAISAAGEVWLGGYYSRVVRSTPQGWETVSPPLRNSPNN